MGNKAKELAPINRLTAHVAGPSLVGGVAGLALQVLLAYRRADVGSCALKIGGKRRDRAWADILT